MNYPLRSLDRKKEYILEKGSFKKVHSPEMLETSEILEIVQSVDSKGETGDVQKKF